MKNKIPFEERPKSEAKKKIGAVLTNLIFSIILRYGLEEQIIFGEKQSVDFIWGYLGFGFECKRLIKTPCVNIRWLRSEVVDRFYELEEKLGIKIHYRALIVNEKKWGSKEDRWLESQGIHVLEVGRIDSREGDYEASLVFMAWFEDMVWKICNGKLKRAGRYTVKMSL